MDPQPNDSLSLFLNRIDDKNLLLQHKLVYADRATKSALNENNSGSIRSTLIKLANFYYQSNEKVKFKQISEALLKNSISAQDTLGIARAYKNLGLYHIENNQNDSSYFYYSKAEKYFLYLNDSNLGDIYLDKAFIYLYASDFKNSEISASKALRYLLKENNKFKIYDAYNLIGICSNQLKDYQKALEYHNKALAYFKENDIRSKFHLDASSLNNIGYVYQNMDMHNLAISNFELALTNQELLKDSPSLYAMLLDNLGYSKFKLRDFSNLPYLFNQSLKIRDSLKSDFSGIILNKIHISQLLSAQNDTLKAIQMAQDALSSARSTNVASDVLFSLENLSNIDQKNAANYSKEYIKISDSLQQAERTAKDKFARIAFETDEIALKNSKLTEQNRTLLYFFVAALMIGTLLFVIRMQRSKNRELLLIQGQQKANEDIYNLMIAQQSKLEEGRIAEKKRIAQELHDGVLGRLFGTRLNLDSLNRMNDDQAIVKRNNYLVELKNIEQDIREISHDLNREKYVLINNFVAILTNLLEEQKANFRPDVAVHIDEKIKWDEISNTLKINLYRIIQESLQNINKYAQATTISLEIKMLEGNLGTIITDNGVGFDISVRKKGIGLQNILSRTQELDGSCDITSKSGNGTSITLSFPVKTSNNNIAKDVNA